MRWQLPGLKTAIWFDARGRRVAGIDAVRPEQASPDGVVALLGELSVETLTRSYRRGIFPWPHSGYPLCWFCPDPRAVLDLDAVHVPKSLARERRKNRFTFTVDRAFAEVIAACRQSKRADQESTWITKEMQAAYTALHRTGVAHSVEAWNEFGELAGGLYGVDSGGVFTGESMFYREDYASKLCLLHLFDHLRERGADWIDIQMMTPHFHSLGATEIPRSAFLERLAATQTKNLRLFDPAPLPPDAAGRVPPALPAHQHE